MLILLYTTLVIHLVPRGIRSLPGLVALYGAVIHLVSFTGHSVLDLYAINSNYISCSFSSLPSAFPGALGSLIVGPYLGRMDSYEEVWCGALGPIWGEVDRGWGLEGSETQGGTHRQ